MAFRLSDSRCEEIKEVVTSLLEKLDISSIPIHGFEIASKLKIIVIPLPKPEKMNSNSLLSLFSC